MTLPESRNDPDEEKQEKEDNDVKEQEEYPLIQRISNYLLIILKIVEVIICCICLGFAFEPIERTRLREHLHYVGIMYTTCSGYILINLVLLVGRTLGDRIPFKTYIVFNIWGVILFVLTGILLSVGKAELMRMAVYRIPTYVINKLITSIVFSFINAGIFIVDIVFSIVRLRSDIIYE